MQWSELYLEDNQPSSDDMEKFIANDLWRQMHEFIQQAYGVSPSQSYSGCAGQPGWNVKYQKSGKSLCTLYPMAGYFIALVVIGNKEAHETELMLPTLCDYVRGVYDKSVALGSMGRWLMVNVTSPEILEDVKRLIMLRVKPKTK